MGIKIDGSKTLRVGLRPGASGVKEQAIAKKPAGLIKDEWKAAETLDLPRALSDHGLRRKDLTIDISSNESRTAERWWSDELLGLLPPLPGDSADLKELGIANQAIFDTLRSLATDKSYLSIKLRDDLR